MRWLPAKQLKKITDDSFNTGDAIPLNQETEAEIDKALDYFTTAAEKGFYQARYEIPGSEARMVTVTLRQLGYHITPAYQDSVGPSPGKVAFVVSWEGW